MGKINPISLPAAVVCNSSAGTISYIQFELFGPWAHQILLDPYLKENWVDFSLNRWWAFQRSDANWLWFIPTAGICPYGWQACCALTRKGRWVWRLRDWTPLSGITAHLMFHVGKTGQHNLFFMECRYQLFTTNWSNNNISFNSKFSSSYYILSLPF